MNENKEESINKASEKKAKLLIAPMGLLLVARSKEVGGGVCSGRCQ